jgi:hypothetical protein
MALRDPAVGGSKSDIKTSAKHVVAAMEDSRTGVQFPPPPPIIVPRPSSQVQNLRVNLQAVEFLKHFERLREHRQFPRAVRAELLEFSQ